MQHLSIRMKIAILLLFFLHVFIVSSQCAKKEAFQPDTLVVFVEGVKTYNFQIEGKRQGFFWGDVRENMNLRVCRFRFYNNTGEIIQIKRVDAGDGSVLFLKTNGVEFLKPNEYVEVEPLFTRRDGSGPFHKTSFLEYVKGSETKSMGVIHWGCFYYTPEQEQKKSDSLSGNSNESVKPSVVKVPKPVVSIVQPPVPLEPAVDKTKPVAAIEKKTINYELKIYRDRENQSALCRLEIIRNGKVEKVLPCMSDSLKETVLAFKATLGEILQARVIHEKLGTMSTSLKCTYPYPYMYQEFIGAKEEYYYAFGNKTLLLRDSSDYQLNFSTMHYKTGLDSAYVLIASSGIPCKKIGWDEVRIDKPEDAIKLEKYLLKSSMRIHLDPKIWDGRDRRTPTFLVNSCAIRFREGVGEEWILTQFKRFQITNFYKTSYEKEESLEYQVIFIHGADRGYNTILDKFWLMKEVTSINQDVIPREDGDE